MSRNAGSRRQTWSLCLILQLEKEKLLRQKHSAPWRNVCYLFRMWENSVPIRPTEMNSKTTDQPGFPRKFFIVHFISQLPQNKECECLGFLDWDIRSFPFIQREWKLHRILISFHSVLSYWCLVSVMFIHLWGYLYI